MLQPKLTSVEVIGQYLLRLEYETGEIKQFDVAPYITGSCYGNLNDEDYFKTVHLASDRYGVAWGNGQDIAPHELYEASINLSK